MSVSPRLFSQLKTKTLDNGLRVMCLPLSTTPVVEMQMWYNVGSKDERAGQRGMAHLLEHMLFKGTVTLSESDINQMVHALAGYTNAATSFDYTCYEFRFPSSAWEWGVRILADCMHNARLDEDMLNSELRAVIQEFKMYRDDYQSCIVEMLDAMALSPHPYRDPIIGYKSDLWNLKREDLYTFYKAYYQPNNALLVCVGDIDPESFFASVQQWFGALLPQEVPQRLSSPAMTDIVSKTVTLYRAVEQPWTCYAYMIPGIQARLAHQFHLLEYILAGGKSSRLYQRLVEERELALDVSCMDYGLADQQLLYIMVVPVSEESLADIAYELALVFEDLEKNGIDEWELEAAKKNIVMEHLGMLESPDRVASYLGQWSLVLGDPTYIEQYLSHIDAVNSRDIARITGRYLRKTQQYAGFLCTLPPSEQQLFDELQKESDESDRSFVVQRQRHTPVEPPLLASGVTTSLPLFISPKPEMITLPSGLVVLLYHRPLLPKIAFQLHMRANWWYDEQPGLSYFHSQLLTEGTRNYSAAAFHQQLDRHGIIISCDSGIISGECPSSSAAHMFSLLGEMVTMPLFERGALERTRETILGSLREYWDSPIDFVDQLARDIVYADHPYKKQVLGDAILVSSITPDDIQRYHQENCSPRGAVISIVGDFGEQHDALIKVIESTLGAWEGTEVPRLILPPLTPPQHKIIEYEIARDQVVLGFVAPSVKRHDPLFEVLALLDVILLGGSSRSMGSRLFSLRERTGLFYTIGGSLVMGAAQGEGYSIIKTVVSADAARYARDEIFRVLDELASAGISEQEFGDAKRALVQSSVGFFESNLSIASVFSVLYMQELPFDLFDKRQQLLSILDIDTVHAIAREYCARSRFSELRIGRKQL